MTLSGTELLHCSNEHVLFTLLFNNVYPPFDLILQQCSLFPNHPTLATVTIITLCERIVGLHGGNRNRTENDYLNRDVMPLLFQVVFLFTTDMMTTKQAHLIAVPMEV